MVPLYTHKGNISICHTVIGHAVIDSFRTKHIREPPPHIHLLAHSHISLHWSLARTTGTARTASSLSHALSLRPIFFYFRCHPFSLGTLHPNLSTEKLYSRKGSSKKVFIRHHIILRIIIIIIIIIMYVHPTYFPVWSTSYFFVLVPKSLKNSWKCFIRPDACFAPRHVTSRLSTTPILINTELHRCVVINR